MEFASRLLPFVLSLSVAACAGTVPGDPVSPNVEIADGDAALRLSQFDTAIAHYTRAIDSGMLVSTDVYGTYFKRAMAHESRAYANGFADQDMVAALQDIAKARETAPSNAELSQAQGNAFQALGDYRDALLQFKEAFAFDGPIHLWSLIGIGSTYRIMGDYPEALRYFDKALANAGTMAGMPIFYHRAVTFFEAGRYREAVESLDIGITKQRGYEWAYAYRACAHARLGEYEKALPDYDAAIEFMRRDAAEYEHAFWQKALERFSAEKQSVANMQTGNAVTIPASELCEKSFGDLTFRPRSKLLPMAADDDNLPELDILPPQAARPAI